VGTVGVGVVVGVVDGVVDGVALGVEDCAGVELLLLGAGFTVIVMTALVTEPFQSRIRYGALDVPVKPAWGVNVTTPVAVSTLKVPSPAMVTVVFVHAGAVSLEPHSRIEPGRSACEPAVSFVHGDTATGVPAVVVAVSFDAEGPAGALTVGVSSAEAEYASGVVTVAVSTTDQVGM